MLKGYFMKKSILILLTITVVIVLFACGEDKNPTEPSKKVTIISIVPKSAYTGDTITVVGKNFGESQGISYISFAGTKATDYTTWNDNEIVIKVPFEAVSGKIWLEVTGEKSNEVDFVVIPTEPMVYETVTIGSQVWMKNNLYVERYRNGDPIPQVTDSTEWANLTTGAWCYYNNDRAKGPIYGKLYNWYAVSDSRGLAPNGYHIPSDDEWTILTNYLKSNSQFWCNSISENVGKSLASNELWTLNSNPCSIGTILNNNNSSGFSALPGGYRNNYGSFLWLSFSGYWWSKTTNNENKVYSPYLYFGSGGVYKTISHKVSGFSVRCIKD